MTARLTDGERTRRLTDLQRSIDALPAVRPTQGTRAAVAALQRAQAFAALVRDEGPEATGAYLDALTPDQHYALTVTLAAMLDVDQTPAALLAWLNTDPNQPALNLESAS